MNHRAMSCPLMLAIVALTAGCGATPDWVVSPSADLSGRIDSLFAEFDEPRSPGGIAVVIQAGEIVHLKGYGSVNWEFGIPWSPYVRYRIASITKGFTGLATLLLADDGKLDLDDPVQQHLPDFPSFATPVRIRHLITNTSGIWYDEWLLPLAGVTGYSTLDEMYALVRGQDRLNYTPGTAHNYIDTNWRIMARIIESVTGQSWQEAMRDLIFEPVGMDATLAPPDVAQVFDDQGTTYLHAGDGIIPPRFEFPFQTSGDGSLITTFDDFIRWLLYVREGFEDGSSVFDRLKGPVQLADGTDVPYGFGIGEARHRGLRGWGHGGATGTYWAFYPEMDLIVAVFSNYLGRISANGKHREIVDAFLASDLSPDPSLLTTSNPLLDETSAVYPELPAADQERLAGTFVDPGSGYVLRSVGSPGSLSHRFLGARAPLQRVAECMYQAAKGINIPPIRVVDPDCGTGPANQLTVRWPGWTSARRFVRAREGHAVRESDYVGSYFSEQLGTYWRVTRSGDNLTLRIGAAVQGGQSFHLEPLLPDIFIAEPRPAPMLNLLALPPLSIKFDRAGGRVSAMHVATERIRGLGFRRR